MRVKIEFVRMINRNAKLVFTYEGQKSLLGFHIRISLSENEISLEKSVSISTSTGKVFEKYDDQNDSY